MKDVAARAGVAVSTVSRILNASGYGSEATRRRVLAASRALGYTPSLSARGLRQSRTMTIGIAVPDLENPVFLSYVRGIENTAGELGYAVAICDAQASGEVQATQLARLFGHRVDGLLVIPPVLAPDGLAPFLRAGVPVVPSAETDVSRVRLHVRATQPAMLAALNALRGYGHERIALVTRRTPMREHASGPGVLDVRVAELRALGYDIDERLILGIDTADDCRATVRHMLARPSPPTAYIVSPYGLAPRLLAALYDSALRIPEDVSFVCHGDSDWAVAHRPPLAVIRHDYYAQAAAWVRSLVDRLDGRPGKPVPILEFEFVPRGSIGPARPLSRRRGGRRTGG